MLGVIIILFGLYMLKGALDGMHPVKSTLQLAAGVALIGFGIYILAGG